MGVQPGEGGGAGGKPSPGGGDGAMWGVPLSTPAAVTITVPVMLLSAAGLTRISNGSVGRTRRGRD